MSESLAPSNSPAPTASGLASPANNNISLNNSSNAVKVLENLEEVLLELTSFEKEISKAGSLIDLPIPATLESYLKLVAHVGTTQFPWNKIKPLFRVKLEQVIHEFNTSSPTSEIPVTPNVDPFNFDAVKGKVFEQLDAFVGIPFTVQRLAELITSPRRHYRRTDKFMRALEKNMLVVSTIEAREAAAETTTPSNEATPVGGTRNLTNGGEHNVLPMSHLRRAQSPTSSGFVKASKLFDSNEKEAQAKVNGEDESMETSDKTEDDNPTPTDQSEDSPTKNPDSSADEASVADTDPIVDSNNAEEDDKNQMDVDEVVQASDEPSTSEDSSEDTSPQRNDITQTPETSDISQTTEASDSSQTTEAKSATTTSQTSSDTQQEDVTSQTSATSEDNENISHPSDSSSQATAPSRGSDDASSSSDVTQEYVDESSKQNESNDDKPFDTPVGTTTDNGEQEQTPDEGEPVIDDGGPCDSADSNETPSAVSSAPAEQTDENAPTDTKVESSESQSLSDEAASSSETKESENGENVESGVGDTSNAPVVGESLPVDQSSVQDPAPAPSESSSDSSKEENMEVDAECTSSDIHIHTST